MDKGYISLWRSIQDNEMWFEEKFTRAQAWIDLLLLANHKNKKMRVRGIQIEVKRGQIGRSKETLADRWQWSRSKVMRFLEELENNGMIEQQKNNKNSRLPRIISIINYEKFQENEQQKDNKKTLKEQQKDTNNNDNNVNKLKKDTNVSKKENIFKKPTLEEVKEYFKEKQTHIDPEKFYYHYESVNWFRGKSKIKNWKLCLNTWEKMDNKDDGKKINKQEYKKSEFCIFCRTGNGFITYEGEKHQCPHGDSSSEILEKLGLI